MNEIILELIDIPTLAARLHDTPRHVRRLVADQRIPYVKVGHFIRFDPTAIADWLAGNSVLAEPRGDE